MQLFSAQNSFFVPACSGAESRSSSVAGFMLNRQLQFRMRQLFYFCIYLFFWSYTMRKEGKQRSSCSSKRAHIIETIHHCHLGATGTVALHTGAYNFLRLVLSRPLTFHSPGLQRIVSATLLASQPGRVFISSCRVSAASIISHCKAIRVLITRGPPSGGDPSTCLSYCTHANANTCARPLPCVSAPRLRGA